MYDELIKLLSEDPATAAKLISGLVEKYKPLVYSVAKDLFNIYKDFANNTEYFATVAKVKINQYNAYIQAGFTPDQAMALLINDDKKVTESWSKVSNIKLSNRDNL